MKKNGFTVPYQASPHTRPREYIAVTGAHTSLAGHEESSALNVCIHGRKRLPEPWRVPLLTRNYLANSMKLAVYSARRSLEPRRNMSRTTVF